MEKEFGYLVKNGLDFLNRAVDEVRKSPKHSTINFYSGVEILLKARLMAEHWTLIVANREEADFNKFLKGDFRSVSLEEIVNRLGKVIRSPLSEGQRKNFQSLKMHRNKMVHFFHELERDDSGKAEDPSSVIMREQLTSWYHLEQLLSAQWKECFRDFEEEICSITNKFRYYKEYLRIKFDQVRGDVDDFRNKGRKICECPACGFEAEIHDPEIKNLYESVCLVCDLRQQVIRVSCAGEGCESEVIFRNEGFAACDQCGAAMEPEDLAKEINGIDHYLVKDGEVEEYANCSGCDGFHTVVPLKSGKWFCAQCFSLFDRSNLDYCDWCGKLNNGDMDGSYLEGCNFCDGNTKLWKD